MAKPLVIKFSRYLHEEIPGLDLSLVQYHAMQAYHRMCNHFGVDEIDRDGDTCFTLRGPVEDIMKASKAKLVEAGKEGPEAVTKLMQELLPDLYSVLIEREDDKIFLRICKSHMTAHEIDDDDEVTSTDGEPLTLKLAFGPDPEDHLSNQMYRRGDGSDIEIGSA